MMFQNVSVNGCDRDLLDWSLDMLGRHGKQLDLAATEGSMTSTGVKYTVARHETLGLQSNVRAIQKQFEKVLLRGVWKAIIHRSENFVPKLVPAPNGRDININMLSGPGAFYEWHKDGTAFSASVPLTSAPIGGEFLVEVDGVHLEATKQQAGAGVLFSGEIPHAVAPLAGGIRVSLVFGWVFEEEGLLYGEGHYGNTQ